MSNSIIFKWFLSNLTDQQRADYREASINQQKDWYIYYLEQHFTYHSYKNFPGGFEPPTDDDRALIEAHFRNLYHDDPSRAIASAQAYFQCLHDVQEGWKEKLTSKHPKP